MQEQEQELLQTAERRQGSIQLARSRLQVAKRRDVMWCGVVWCVPGFSLKGRGWWTLEPSLLVVLVRESCRACVLCVCCVCAVCVLYHSKCASSHSTRVVHQCLFDLPGIFSASSPPPPDQTAIPHAFQGCTVELDNGSACTSRPDRLKPNTVLSGADELICSCESLCESPCPCLVLLSCTVPAGR